MVAVRISARLVPGSRRVLTKIQVSKKKMGLNWTRARAETVAEIKESIGMSVFDFSRYTVKQRRFMAVSIFLVTLIFFLGSSPQSSQAIFICRDLLFFLKYIF